MTRDDFAANDAPLQNEDIVICKRVFDHICAAGHITRDDACDELATQIIYFYQHGVRNEDSLEQLLTSIAEKQR
ncbi:hypothetical protein C9413_10670 [Rhizobium sp. SEMIA 4085]|uniref:Uncharacterized protein n=1 Tax=Rhizobium gallicum bv. gallicum R602sp TaxID=1041138 RepID=A0A0B4XHY5_9HYPH|nr:MULTISPECIES: hypothetical protein [Rhizobium]AJD46037.1 hypothetical protein RGR602_PC02014 [Rhizobium gallicum bv. gallicum R602sp]NNH29947.1 hypothetical protein [Rhizobium sp. SEMIA 4085]TDW32332.1 hypothetical protein EV128_107201 [Rhizobium azibense]